MQTAISTSRARLAQPARSAQQILIRLPYDLACQLAKSVPSRGRNQYVVDVLKRELESEKAEKEAQLIAACEAMNAYEAVDQAFAQEGMDWANAVLTDDEDDDFDRELFLRELAIAQATRRKTSNEVAA
jgi:hypothetical protein